MWGALNIQKPWKLIFGWDLSVILTFSNGPLTGHFSFHQWSTSQLERTIILLKNLKTKNTDLRNIHKFYDSVLEFISLINFKGRKDSLWVKFGETKVGWESLSYFFGLLFVVKKYEVTHKRSE